MAEISTSRIREILSRTVGPAPWYWKTFPALVSGSVRRMWAGLRPVTADGRPIVGSDPKVPGLWYATGHGRNGVLLAVLTGEVMADLLTTGATAVNVAPWRPDRLDASAK